MEDQDTVVKTALSNFLRKHSAEDVISAIDEIVLSYVVSILEELGTDEVSEDAFDVESFIEMMEAYLPGFGDISSVQVCEWMFELAGQLGENHSGSSQGQQTLNGGSTLSFTPPSDCFSHHKTNSGSPPKDTVPPNKGRSKSRTNSTSDKDVSFINTVQCTSKEPAEQGIPDDDDPMIDVLLEMFPSACTLELSHCLCLAGRDVEQAARLVLHRQESGDSIKPTPQSQRLKAQRKSESGHDDQKLRDSLISKYSYIDTEEDKKDHKPLMPKTEPKKLVRYLDSKVVSTKGERYTEVKKPEDEEHVKKTTVNLKPAKQYRFH